MAYFPLLALAAGAAIAIQAAMNAKLGLMLKNALLGTSIVFAICSLITLVVTALVSNSYPQLADIKAIPG